MTTGELLDKLSARFHGLSLDYRRSGTDRGDARVLAILDQVRGYRREIAALRGAA